MNLDTIPFIKARNFTRGRSVNPSLIVIHDMEAGEYSSTAENCASYFAGANAPRASAHYNCDNNSTVCSVKPDDTAWHTAENRTNNCGIGIEQAGYANQGIGPGTGWNDQYSQDMILGQVAPLVAALCQRYGIPVQFLSAADLAAGNLRGISSHREITYGFKVYGGHTDPGPDYPFGQLLGEVNRILGNPLDVPYQPTAGPNPGVWTVGSTGNKVKDIQKLVGVTADGVFGPATAAAVTAWQKKLQIPADGVWGPRTEEATTQLLAWVTRQPSAPQTSPFLEAVADSRKKTIGAGNISGAVKIAQLLLGANGFHVATDGVFGPATVAATKRFQAANRLKADGIIGPNTWSALLD
jgi:peptidoglycan hydrolase-like protein with peptidoglycan-binding domain